MTTVEFHNPAYEPECALTYSVIGARYKGRWVFVRHHLRNTTEIPGGHIEEGESSHEAACRELMEETGAVVFSMECVATYSVNINGETGWGRLYFSEISELGPLPDTSEIAEVILGDHFLLPNTHPEIQPKLFERIEEYLGKKG